MRAYATPTAIMLNCDERNNGRGLNVTKAEQCAAMGVTAMCGFVLNPWAAIGAFGGCCFLMAMPSATSTFMQRVLLAFFSWVMGYGSGAVVYPGPPWSQEAMLVSAAAAALSSVAFTGIYAAISENKDLPPWLLSISEMIKNWGRK